MALTQNGKTKILGGMTGLLDDTAPIKGVYANFPASTPKFHPGSGIDSLVATQARLFVAIPNAGVYKAWHDALSVRGKELARVLAARGSYSYSDRDAGIARVDLSAGAQGSSGVGYVDFTIQGLSASSSERYQVHETLSDGYVVYFMGQRPVTLTVQGMVMNTNQDGWYDAWHVLYSEVIRGTRMARMRLPVYLRADTRIYRGSILAESTSITAQNETTASFQFQMLLSSVNIIKRSVDFTAPTDLSALSGLSASELLDFSKSRVLNDAARRQATREAESAAASVESGAAATAATIQNGRDIAAVAEEGRRAAVRVEARLRNGINTGIWGTQ